MKILKAGLLFLCILSLIAGLFGCGKSTTQKETDKVFTSSDGTVSITATNKWKEYKGEGTAEGQILSLQKGIIAIEGILIHSVTNENENATLESVIQVMRENMPGSNMTDITDLTIDGSPAKMFEVEADIEGTEVLYIVTAIEKDGKYYIVTAFTKMGTDNFKKNKEERIKMTKSLKFN